MKIPSARPIHCNVSREKYYCNIVLTRYTRAPQHRPELFSQRSLDMNYIPLKELIDRWKFYENKQNSFNEAEIKCFIIWRNWGNILTRAASDHEKVYTLWIKQPIISFKLRIKRIGSKNHKYLPPKSWAPINCNMKPIIQFISL